MLNTFIFSQILMSVSLGITIYAFQTINDKKFRLLFVISSIIAAFHFLLLGAFSAAVIVFISALRWLVSIFYKNKFFLFLFITIILMSSYWTYRSWISFFPVVAGILGVIATFHKREHRTREILIGATIFWMSYNILIFTPVGIISETIFLIANLFGCVKLRKKNI